MYINYKISLNLVANMSNQNLDDAQKQLVLTHPTLLYESLTLNQHVLPSPKAKLCTMIFLRDVRMKTWCDITVPPLANENEEEIATLANTNMFQQKN